VKFGQPNKGDSKSSFREISKFNHLINTLTLHPLVGSNSLLISEAQYV
jgi:hypothetical protein